MNSNKRFDSYLLDKKLKFCNISIAISSHLPFSCDVDESRSSWFLSFILKFKYRNLYFKACQTPPRNFLSLVGTDNITDTQVELE